MRRFAAVAAVLFLAACATTTVQPEKHFKVLHLNDVYKVEGLEGGQSGGLARVRTLRTHLESDGSTVLLLHGGDALYPSVMSKYLDAQAMVDVMNQLDGDAKAFDPRLIVTFGNHEFDKSTPDVLLARLKESAFPWISTNAFHCNPKCDQPFPGVQRTMIVDAGGTRVGIFGVMYELTKNYVNVADPVASAREAVAQLRRDGARVVIAVTHQDMPQDVDLVQQVPGIDLVIGGHDHLFMQQKVGSTWVSKADADAKSVIVYDIRVPPAGPIRTTPLRVVLDATVPQDANVNASVRKWLDALSAKLGGNQTLGTTQFILEGVEPAVRGRETALGNLLTDVARAQMGTQIGLLNGGSIRINDNIPPGPITTYDMEGIFYYTNTLVAFELTGQQLLDMLRNSVSRADAGDGRFLQVSGLRFRYSGANGTFTVDPKDVTVGGAPLDLNKKYSVATIDYVYTNGAEDGYTLFASDATRPPKINTEREADFRKSVEAAIQKTGEVTTTIEGRIVRK
jgi:2',3'-cyclic-nucleotide 2'-phosphodiesterase (5'-nucleotidase family)